MASERTANERRVLFLAPTARDGTATRDVLAAAKIECLVCSTLEAVCAAAADGAAAVIVPEETIVADSADVLVRCLAEQPVWSDLPVIVLSSRGVESPAVAMALTSLRNVSLLERPMRLSTMVSAVRSALRARERQYEVRDHIDERRRAEQILERDALLLSSVRDAVIVTDLTGIVTFWNEGATRLLGWTAAEMVGQPMSKRLPEEFRAQTAEWIKRIASGEADFEGEWLDYRKDGSQVWIEASTRRVSDASGQPIGIMGVSRDISERKRANSVLARNVEERARLLESERAAREEAERAGRMKDEFLATLSHELRTPLSAILGWSTMLRRPNTKPEATALGLETIERNARAQAQIIEDLLDMSRIANGKVNLAVRPIDLATVIRAAIETVRAPATAKRVEVKFECAGREMPVIGDATRLQQVFWNLLSNAIKFTPVGGAVEVHIAERDGMWQADVIDTGEGIGTDFLPYVFDRFRQADASTTRRHGGLGLGLAIVKQLVELHGGSVSVASAGPGKGATFGVSLPVAVAAPSPAPVVVGAPKMSGEASAVDASSRMTWDASMTDEIRGKKIVVVDDEADARTLLRRLLEECGALVFAAATAQEALAIICRERPDVLVSDIGMPGGDGYELMRRVRALNASEGGAIPAVALTAYARPEDRVKAVRAGFQLHVPKPVEPVELVAVVANLVARRA